MALRLTQATAVAAACLPLSFATASTPLTPQTMVNATNEAVSDIGAFVGLGADLHAYESVKPYSTLKGLDFGVDLTAVALSGSITNALTVLGVPNVPHYIPLPKINVQKALTDKIFVGGEFIPNVSIKGNVVSMYGFDAQWTAVDRYQLPPVAFRAQFNWSNLVVATAATYGFDVITGWKLLFVDLYGGAGYRYVKASVSNPTATQPSTPGVDLNTTTDAGHFMAGVTMTAGFTRVTAEADLTTRGVNTYGTKLSFFF